MGLRIIDRAPYVPPPSEREQLEQLAHEMQEWSRSRGGLDKEAERLFLDQYRKARSRVREEQDIFALASRIEVSLRAAYVARTPCHAKVDVATLLALL